MPESSGDCEKGSLILMMHMM